MNSPDASLFNHVYPVMYSIPSTKALQHTIVLTRQPLNPLLLPVIQILSRKFLTRHTIISTHSIQCTPPKQHRSFSPDTTHVVLLFHIDPALIFAYAQFLVLGHRFHFAVVALVAQRCGGCEEEAAEQHGADEGQAEEREGVFGEGGAVAGGQGVVVGA